MVPMQDTCHNVEDAPVDPDLLSQRINQIIRTSRERLAELSDDFIVNRAEPATDAMRGRANTIMRHIQDTHGDLMDMFGEHRLRMVYVHDVIRTYLLPVAPWEALVLGNYRDE